MERSLNLTVRFLKKYLIHIIVVYCCSSCNAILSKLYGVKEITNVDELEINEFVRKNTPQSLKYESFIIDSLQFSKLFPLTENQEYQNALKQPIQIFYFQKNNLVSYHANCYAKGKLNGVDWNYNGKFNSFPTVSDIDIVNFQFDNNSFSNIFGVTESQETETIIIVFWSTAFPKIAKSAIQTVYDNLHVNNKIPDSKIIYINTDDYFRHM